MYMMRLVYHCTRSKSLEVVECLKTLNQIYTSDGCTNGKVYVDRMDAWTGRSISLTGKSGSILYPT